jgi:hypothetical protein
MLYVSVQKTISTGTGLLQNANRKAIASLLDLSPTLWNQLFYSDKAISSILREECGVNIEQKLARVEELEHIHQLEERMEAQMKELTKRRIR